MFFKNCNPKGYELNFDIKKFLFVFFSIFFSTPYSLRSEQRECQQQSRAWPFSFSKKKKKGKNEDRENCSTSNIRLNKPFPYEEREKKT